MKSMKRLIALFLIVSMLISNMSVQAAELNAPSVNVETETEVKEVVEETEGQNTVEKIEIEEPEGVEGTETEEPGSIEKMEAEESGIVEETEAEESEIVERTKISFNLGNYAWTVGNEGDYSFAEDGSYTIVIPEKNPFFPYEVQFACDGNITTEWFMTPDDSVEVFGHTFYVTAEFDNTAVTQMSLRIAGDIVTVYPEGKVFTEGEEAVPFSLLPLEERSLFVDLSGYTPAELTMVSVASIFTGEEMLETDSLIWSNQDDEYTVSKSGDKIDLSQNTSSGSTTWEMIVGDPDQLASQNIRYIVRTSMTRARNWLVPTVTLSDGTGDNLITNAYYYDYDKDGRVLSMDIRADYGTDVITGFAINPEVFAETHFATCKIFEGSYRTASEAVGAKDITEAIRNNQYVMKGYSQNVTMLTYDAEGNTTGCLPFKMNCYREGNMSSHINIGGMFTKTESGRDYVYSRWMTSTSNAIIKNTFRLYKEYPVDGTYFITMDYQQGLSSGGNNNSAVTAAYCGNYDTIAAAETAKAENIKDQLFSKNYNTAGYGADYSKGVTFTIFVGKDGLPGQEVYKYIIQAEAGDESKYENVLHSGTGVDFRGLKDGEGNDIPCYAVGAKDDSYGEYNFRTILVGAETDLTDMAPVFTTSEGVHLYAAGSNTPEKSGVSRHDFSNGAVHYTAGSENGENAKNIWLRILKMGDNSEGLYLSSLQDRDAETRKENGVVYTKREVMLDGLHDNQHSILLINSTDAPMSGLTAELNSEILELDGYWTLNGVYELAGFTTLDQVDENGNYVSYGELPNMAKLKLKPKAGIADGTDISGTLTIKSGGKAILVMTLTGTVGDPTIVTDEVPQAVKYVPYGSMIQNNNKYSWNKVTYSLVGGKLPGGMIIRENGELYGVPLETGTFKFVVYMQNSYHGFSSARKEFTLTVLENTDMNVNNATDTGYFLTDRIPDIYTNQLQNTYLMVSEGEIGEFIDIYLDGRKLTKGTDYDAKSGSTRITILKQTLTEGMAEGTHTLGIEFRESGTDLLKRAAQNYKLYKNGTAQSDNGNQNDSHNNSVGNQDIQVTSERTVTYGTYVVKRGDSLWKIAQRVYGNGALWTRIYNDNRDVLSNPNRLRVGQVLKICSDQTTAVGTVNTTVDVTAARVYTVKRGDSLWKIAVRVYHDGREWSKIYNANMTKISDPNIIRTGQKLIIPE